MPRPKNPSRDSRYELTHHAHLWGPGRKYCGGRILRDVTRRRFECCECGAIQGGSDPSPLCGCGRRHWPYMLRCVPNPAPDDVRPNLIVHKVLIECKATPIPKRR